MMVLIKVHVVNSDTIAGGSPKLMFTVLGVKGAIMAVAVVNPITILLGDFIQVFKYLYQNFNCLYYLSSATQRNQSQRCNNIIISFAGISVSRAANSTK